ncbi:hypothetical protein JB92DRAFT_2791696 [Gautieria morchelliformis]|nr:hypothetical protein JB92DRAFT_2791696 [Gautieria morchelliformis]
MDKSATGKPTKKVRKDGSLSATRTNVHPNARQKSSVEANPESTHVYGQGARNTVGRQRQQVAPTNSATLDEEDGNDCDSPALEEVEEDEIQLQGFSSESDSSDEDLDVRDAPPLDINTMPSFSKDDAVVQRKLEKAKKNPTEDRGVIYLGRIPHGFYEDQMRNYFSQFGNVTRLRLSRNKKTGKSKHYAFIEFSSSAVADIVSETMDNYLLLGHILQCKIIPNAQVHPELWVGANKKWRFIPRDRIARVKQNKPRTQEEQKRAEAKLVARQKKRQAKISASGIQYDFEDVAYVRPLLVSSATHLVHVLWYCNIEA